MIFICIYKIYYEILIEYNCLFAFDVLLGLSPLSRYHVYVLVHIIYERMFFVVQTLNIERYNIHLHR